MKYIFIGAFSLINLFLNSFALAYCVYNTTTGQDTQTRYGYKSTIIYLDDEQNKNWAYINQGDYRCFLTNRRNQNDTSVINIEWIKLAFPNGGDGNVIFSKEIFNKGGYMIVSGNAQAGFKCDVYRD